MQEQRPRRSFPLGLIAGFSLMLLTMGGGLAWWSSHGQPAPQAAAPAPATTAPPDSAAPAAHQPPPVQPATTPPAPPRAGSAESGTSQPAAATPGSLATGAPQTYWVKDEGNKIALVPAPVAGAASTQPPGDKAEAALKTLLSGPNSTGVTTTIPKETKLRSVTVKPDGIHVDLSKDFAEGGGSSSMKARVGQVLYTVTSEDPNAKVWFSVEGKPVQSLGGEGLDLAGPITRKNFERDFPL